MYTRFLEREIIESLGISPVVLIRGARYSGKTTLAKSLLNKKIAREYITFDSPEVLIQIEEDVEQFFHSLPPRTVIDEVQRIPHYFHVIKKIVDDYRSQGNKGNRFILTGSANIFLLPKLSESLAGRMSIFTMRPLSQGEIISQSGSVLDNLFDENFRNQNFDELGFNDIAQRIFQGGFPDVVNYKPKQRTRFFDSYVRTLLERDIKSIANIEGLHKIPTILRCIANNIGNLHNTANLSRDTGITVSSLKNYLSILKALYLIEECPSWTTNGLSRVVKAPKYYLSDTALAIYLTGFGEEHYLKHKDKIGALLENFVYQEFLKQLEWSSKRYQIMYFRNSNGTEVDFIIERQDGKIISIEVKTASSLQTKSLKGLNFLSQNTKDKIVHSYILHLGKKKILSDTSTALPVSSLWS